MTLSNPVVLSQATAQDSIARYNSARQRDMVWLQWGVSEDDMGALALQWQNEGAQAISALDDISLRVACLRAKTDKSREAQEMIRDRAVCTIRSPLISEFVATVAWEYELPELLGVTALLEAPAIALKTMWSGSVTRAIASNNEEIIWDHLARFQEDARRHAFPEQFQTAVNKRLSDKMAQLRTEALFDAVSTTDSANATALLARMVQDRSIKAPGDALALLTGVDEGQALASAALALAKAFISRAEAAAMHGEESRARAGSRSSSLGGGSVSSSAPISPGRRSSMSSSGSRTRAKDART